MSLDQSGKVVPGIPLAALDAIEDANVRDVLRALVSTHNVRNNVAGAGSEAFITTRQALLIVRGGTLGATGVELPPLPYYTAGPGGDSYGPGSLSAPLDSMPLAFDVTTTWQITVLWQSLGASTTNTRVEIHDGAGVVLLSQSDSARGGYARSHAASAAVTLAAGAHTLTFHAGNDSGGGSYALGRWAWLMMPVAP
jgi:hypothetical protein